MFQPISSEVFGKLKKNSVFFKIFTLFVAASIIPAVCIGLLSMKHSTEHIIKQMNNSVNAVLQDKANMISQRFDSINYSAMQMVMRTEIWRLMGSENLSDSYHFGMSSVTLYDAYRSSYATVKGNNPLIDSIYIYSNNSDFVLANTKYTKSDFYDREVLGFDFEGYQYISRPRYITENDIEKRVVTLIRRYDIFPSMKKMFVALNINYDTLFDGISLADMEYPYEFMIVDRNLNRVFEDDTFDISIEDDDITLILGSRDNYKYTLNGKDFYIIGKSFDSSAYAFIYIQKYSDIVQSFSLFNKMMVSTLTVIFILSFFAACVFSLSVYKPLNKLVNNIRRLIGLNGNSSGNIYDEIDNAVSSLSNKNMELESKYKLVLPYMENYSLRDMLTDKHTDTGDYRSILKALGVQFVYTSYIIALIDFENTSLTDEAVFKMKTFLYEYNEDFVFLLSKINLDRIALIINMEKNDKVLYSIFKKMKETFNSFGIELTISLGEFCDNLDVIYENYKVVERQLENKFFTGINEILFSSEFLTEGKNLFYDKDLENELLSHIRFANYERAILSLDKLFLDIQRNIDSIDYIKYNFFRIISNIIFVLTEFGIDPCITGLTNTEIFEKIQNTSTISDLRLFITDFIKKSITYIDGIKRSQHKELVERTVKYLESNYRKDISLDDIANAVYVSPRYLCGIFKTEKGTTVFEYITKIRMDAAGELLNTGRNVQDIAQDIGYNNVQSFYRFFKKYYNMTPVQFRRKFYNN